jgi:hypothetical protein
MIQKKISIHRAVELAMYNLAMEGQNRFIPLFRVWGTKAEYRIGSYTQYERLIKVLDVTGCRTEQLPCCAVAVTGILLGDHGTDCSLVFQNAYSFLNKTGVIVNPLDAFMVVDVSAGRTSCTDIQYRVQDNSIVFASKYCQGKVTVEMLCLQYDCDELPMINENHIEAIAKWIELQWMERKKHTRGGIQYNGAEIERTRIEWHRLCANARAEDGEPSASERAEIVAMINDPLSGIGNAYWTAN